MSMTTIAEVYAKINPAPNFKRVAYIAAIVLGLSFHITFAYLYFTTQQYQIDFTTFYDIGTRFINGAPVYGENSYYPMPFVAIFGLFAMLPKPIAMLVWYIVQLSLSLIAGGGVWIFAFAPLQALQTAAPGMIGLWGYRRNQSPDSIRGALWLALTTLKPQLGIIPCLWALSGWIKHWRDERRIPKQAVAFVAIMAVIYLPFFVTHPGWVGDWLASPRGPAYRAMAGIVPRLLYLAGLPEALYWGLLVVIFAVVYLWLCKHGKMSLDILVVLWFVISPLVHDYDTIQLIPIIAAYGIQGFGMLLAAPLWWVILFAYGNNHAWGLVAIIPPAIFVYIMQRRSKSYQHRTDWPQSNNIPALHQRGL